MREMPKVTAEYDAKAGIEPRSRRTLWIILLIAATLLPLSIWRCAREIRPSFPPVLVVVDQVFASPNGTNAVRVAITDGGATGYGGISVYRYSVLTGYEEIYSAAPAVADTRTLLVTWPSESAILLKYEDPYKSPLIEVDIPLEH